MAKLADGTFTVATEDDRFKVDKATLVPQMGEIPKCARHEWLR